MVVYLHYAHATGLERLARLMGELFALSISMGAISNILARARQPLLDATATTEKVVLASPVVCSDDFGAGQRQELVGVAEPAKNSSMHSIVGRQAEGFIGTRRCCM